MQEEATATMMTRCSRQRCRRKRWSCCSENVRMESRDHSHHHQHVGNQKIFLQKR